MLALPNCSLAESLASLTIEERNEALKGLTEKQCADLLHDWKGFLARPNQLPPAGDWIFWVILAGRGYGKTRTGAETVREWARNPQERILMVAPTASDVRDVMIEGPSGLMSCFPPEERPEYLPTRHLVLFQSGAVGITRSADEPERLRGPQFTKFWADELCAWRFVQDAWDQIQFGFRQVEAKLRGVITTTPKPIVVLKGGIVNGRKVFGLLQNPKTVITRGSSYENQSNLSLEYFDSVIKPYEGTRLGRQEINAEIIEDVEGALWTHAMIDEQRVALDKVPPLVRVVVAIDPSVTAKTGSAECGKIVAGISAQEHVYILDDRSKREPAAAWARDACVALLKWDGDRIIGEVNNGGDLVEMALRTIHPMIPYRSVRASRGKLTRAEPVAAMYERGRVHHVGSFPDLESQMCTYVPGESEDSPDRMDALVWALFDLAIDPQMTEIASTPDPRQYQISPY